MRILNVTEEKDSEHLTLGERGEHRTEEMIKWNIQMKPLLRIKISS